MGGTKSRNKGQRGEREFITILQGVVDEVFGEGKYELKRNLQQTQNGGCDITGLPDHLNIIAVEVKRCETLNINGWWRQACVQADLEDKRPVLAYRQSRKPWKIIMACCLPWCERNIRGEISLEDFLFWYKRTLEFLK